MPDVFARQAARRLVKHEHAAADRHRTGDLHHLPVRDRQAGHHGIGGDVGPAQLAERRPRCLAARGGADESGSRGLDAEQDVVGDGEVRGEGEFLVDHRHAGGPRVAGRTGLVGSAVEQHRAGVGPDHSGEHLHERALARAVFAHQREHLAAGHAQVHTGQRGRRAKRLAHAPHHEAIRWWRGSDQGSWRIFWISGLSTLSRVTTAAPVSIIGSTGLPCR